MAAGPNRSSAGLASLNSHWQTAVAVCFVTSLCYGSTKLGGMLAINAESFWPLWLGNVLLASVLLLVPRRKWPIFIAAVFAAYVVNDFRAGMNIQSVSLLVLADLAEILTAALCLSYVFRGVPKLNSVKALAKFSLFAVILAPCVPAFFGALTTNGDKWRSWKVTFFSEAIVYLTLMPAILGWFGKSATQSRKSLVYYLEAAALICGLVSFAYLALAAPGRYGSEALLYSLVPFMLWSALRFGTTGVSTAAMAIAVLAIWGATHGRGPFAESGPLHGVPSLQLFLFFAAAPFMVLAAVVEENREAKEQLFRSIFENMQIGIGIFNIQTGKHLTNRAAHEMLGYSQEELSSTEQWDHIVHPEERASSAERFADLVRGNRDKDQWEHRFIRRDGRIVIANSICKVIRDAAGAPKFVVILNEDITEPRLAEAERIRITTQMQLLLDSTGQGVYGLDMDGNCTFINKAACQMIGYGTEEMLGQNMHKLVHHHRADGSPYPVEECPVYRAFKIGKGCRTDEEILWRRDGSMIPVEYSSFPIWQDGSISGAVVTISDIAERKYAKEALQSSERLFRSIFEGAQVGIGVFRIDVGKHFSNRALHEMLGYTEEQLGCLGQWDEIVPFEERALCAQRYADLVEGRRDTDEYEQHFIHRDGRILLGNSRFRLLRDSEGKPQCVVALTEDITERNSAREALQASERLFRSLYENAQIGIGVLNIATRQHFINRAQSEMLGYSQEELSRTEQWDDIVHPEERASGAKRYAALVAGRLDKDEYTQRFIRRDGQIVTASGRFTLIRDSAGTPQHVIALHEDITERLRAEAELVTAKETAVAATKAKSEFLANMSHEIRTPMNAILGMTHLALKTELTPKQRDYLAKVRAAAQSLLGIINDILDFSKIEAGKLAMEQTEFHLDDVLDNLSTVVCQRAHEKNLEFLIAVQPDLPPALVGDPLRLGQVLINLVNNAVKFTERGEIVVTAQREEMVSERIKLKFTVRDSGIGMTPGQIAHLFQAFSQADTSTTRRYGGTGLGLSISKRLVEMMGGSIWAQSQHGQGSTFYFTAWFGVGAAVQRRQKVLPLGLAGIRVLVVDDNAVACEILADTLRQFTLRVDCVSSGNEALRELAKADTHDPYQLVLMDWQMPGPDGLETSRRIKSGSLRNLPKILLITAFGREDIRLQAHETEIEGFLQKPVSPSVLFDTLMSLFGARGEEKAPAATGKVEPDLPVVEGVRVLLVEDNEVNQQVAKELLENGGAEVTIANHGAEAVRLLGGSQPPPFDVVLMDLQMPEMDGLTATSLLRAQPHLHQLPIIAMTAHAMPEEIQRCLEAGMNDHVAKPIDPEAFFATVARWTRPHPHPVAGPTTKSATEEDGPFFPEIDGVDIAGGLQRVAGNKRLYRDLLTQFAAKQESAGNRIKEAFESRDHKQAERLAHSLKGVAGNLGMNEIFQAGGKLEGAIRASRTGIEDLIEEFTSALDRQVRNIRTVLLSGADEKTRLESRPTDPAKVLTALMDLKALLDANDADAPEAYANVTLFLQGAIDKSQWEDLGAAVKSFDFDTAVQKLNELVKEFGAREKLAE